MAKRSENGIEYFPINADIVSNPKIKLVVAEFGVKSWAVLLPLYCKIYREKGYWIDWFDEDSKLLFAQDECKVEKQFVNEFVNGCIRRSLFNKRVFETFGVLTSDRIQENYLEAKKRNKEISFIGEFAVKNDKNEYVHESFQNVNIVHLNADIITKKVNIPPQNKNENKNERIEVNKKREKETEIIFPFLSTSFKDLWENWKIYKKREFKKSYRTAQSEQAALQNVFKLSNGIESIAEEIIQRSIANQWQGLFEIKNNNNNNNNNGHKPFNQSAKQQAASNFINSARDEYLAARGETLN